eukprot:4034260-Pyramimonas_sp.AAC.1
MSWAFLIISSKAPRFTTSKASYVRANSTACMIMKCSPTPQNSALRPCVCSQKRCQSIAPPLRRLMNFRHHNVVRGPGTGKST